MRGEEAHVSQHIDVPLRRPTVFGEVTVNVAEEHEAIVYDEYEICDSHEYFDLHFRTQSIEVPVVIRKRRSESVALSYDSRESSAATMEEKVVDIEIIRCETSATSDEFIEHKKALIETALSSVDTQYEFTRWQKAVQEVVVSESRNIKALRAMSVDSTDYEVSIECAPFYGRVTMVEKTLAPTPCASASIHIAERLVDVDLSFSRAHGMCVEITRKLLRLIGIHLTVRSTRSETVEVGRMVERVSENQQVSVIIVSPPPPTELNCATSSFAQSDLCAELRADCTCMMNISTIRRAANEAANVARLQEAAFIETGSEVTFERIPAEQLLVATVTTYPPPLLGKASANFAFTKLNQWLNSLVVREITLRIVRKVIRRCNEYLRLKATTLEESNVDVNFKREFVNQTGEIILISQPPPIKAQVKAEFAWQESCFSFCSAVIRELECHFVTKVITRESDSVRLSAATLEEVDLEVVLGRGLEEEHLLISFLSQLPPEKAKLTANIAWQEMDYSFDSVIDQHVQLNILVKLVTNAFTSMCLRATTIEEGQFSVFMSRRPIQDEVFVTVIAPQPPMIARVCTHFVWQQSEFSFDSSVIHEVQYSLVTKAVNKSCTSMALRATVQEEREIGITMERTPHQEETLATLICRRPQEKAKLMRDFAWEEMDFSFGFAVGQHVEFNFLTKVFIEAFASMRLHATMLEDGEFGVLVRRKADQEEIRVSILAPVSPALAVVRAGFVWQQTQFSFDSAVVREIQFVIVTKAINRTGTSMSLRAAAMEEGEFDAVLARQPHDERIYASFISYLSPVKSERRADFALQEVSFSFDSTTTRQIEFDVVEKIFNKARISLQLHEATLQEVGFCALLDRELFQEAECVAILSPPSRTATEARTELAWQESDFSLHSAVAREIQLGFAPKSVSKSRASMQLRATTLEEGEFHIAMERKSDEDEVLVKVLSYLQSVQTTTHMLISEISEDIEFLQTSREEECVTILKEIFTDEGLGLLLLAFGFTTEECPTACNCRHMCL